MLKKRRFYTLTDIKKQLTFTPLIFVFIMATISIVVVISILEVKKNNETKLFLQKEKFNKKIILNQYIDEVKTAASAPFDEEEIVLNDRVTSLSGYIEYSKKDIGLYELKKLIERIEKSSFLDFVIFDKKSLNILHGEDIIDDLEMITDSKIEVKKFQRHMLKNILYIGNDNLIYWMDKDRRKIRLSYFKNIEDKDWFLGAFSRIDDMKDSIRNVILTSIVQKSKYYNNSYFWFYDYDSGYVFNYYNKGQRVDAKYILEKDRLNSSNKILRKYKEEII